ncbi:MAG: hypothetical protein JWO06_4090, partial [Bacteroidota bacterium]|nr:hypothetical protein [Bacteroidota bacterium]
MKHFLSNICVSILLLIVATSLSAQADYPNDRLAEWQQKVDYKIEVS